MAKLVKCKSCGAEIAKSAKACPKCGAKRKRPVLGSIILILGIILLAAGIGGAMSGDGSPQKIGENHTQMPEESKMPTTFGVNDQVELNDIIVTLNGISETSGSQFNKPTDGNVFVLCEFTIENNSEKDISVSSLLSFEAYIDDYSTNMSLTATMEKGSKSQLDGSIAAGKKMNGVIGYEAPKDYKNIEIKFTPSFWSGNDITFVYDK